MKQFKSIAHIEEEFRIRKMLLDDWLKTGKPFFTASKNEEGEVNLNFSIETNLNIPLSQESYDKMVEQLETTKKILIEEFQLEEV
jgi:hypothetical protein